MSSDIKTLADAQPGGRVRLADQALSTTELRRNAHVLVLQELRARFTDAGSPSRTAALDAAIAALSAQPSPGGQDALVTALEVFERRRADIPYEVYEQVKVVCAVLAARQPVGEPVTVEAVATVRRWSNGDRYIDWLTEGGIADLEAGDVLMVADRAITDEDGSGEVYTAPPARVVGRSFQAGVAEWMGQCFLPSLYSNMTERGDRLLEEVLELLQAHGYDKARVPTLVDYVFSRPVGDPAQEVGGVMVTLAGYCWVAGLDMHVHGHAELARISHPEVMAKIRAKQEAKSALHFDTPLPGNAARQTVGEIDEAAVLRRAAAVLYMWEDDPNLTGYMGDFKDACGILELLAQHAVPPAQAVDLGQSVGMAELDQILLDPENQPSQFGTVPTELLEKCEEMISDLVHQFGDRGCTCTFPEADCCAYARAEHYSRDGAAHG